MKENLSKLNEAYTMCFLIDRWFSNQICGLGGQMLVISHCTKNLNLTGQILGATD